VASLLMLAAVGLVSRWLALDTVLLAQARLIVTVIVGVAVYALFTLMINRKQMIELIHMARMAL